jgi:ABC-type multidrug transport system fused ATPase/permease subunit
MSNDILSNQNTPENIKLLRASTVAYTKAKGGENSITYFLLFLAIAYPICYLFIKDENVKLVLFGCSFLVTIFIQVFSDSFKGDTSKGAIFKEEFDTIIFNLPWKSTLKKPDRREVLHYSQQYKGKSIRDWYSPKLSESIEHNIAVAVLQHSNTSYDIELRKAYRSLLICLLLIYSIVLSVLFVYLKTDALTIFLLLFSLLSFFTDIFSIIRGHAEAIGKREAISKHLDEKIRNKNHFSLSELRDIQDEIYLTRRESVKVPNFFFRFHQKQFNAEIEEYIEEINNLYHF